MYRDRPGCLEGLFRLFLLNTLFSWLQRTIGFGRGCGGFGCGVILLLVFGCLVVSTICQVDWLRLFVVGVVGQGG
jgi:hypothetical protein